MGRAKELQKQKRAKKLAKTKRNKTHTHTNSHTHTNTQTQPHTHTHTHTHTYTHKRLTNLAASHVRFVSRQGLECAEECARRAAAKSQRLASCNVPSPMQASL